MASAGSMLQNDLYIFQSSPFHVWYIYLHLVDSYGKRRYIYAPKKLT